MSIGHITFEPLIVETIRVRLASWIEENHSSRLAVAEKVGRNKSTIAKFLCGDDCSSSLAADLCAAIPELAEGITCPYCQRPMPGVAKESGIIPPH